MNRKGWIAGAILLALLLILGGIGSRIAWNEWKGKAGSVGQRAPLPAFGYCSSRQSMPCVLSFNLDQDGDMTINVLTDSLQDFYIKTRYEEDERIYECQRVSQYSTHVMCSGKAMPSGTTVSFLIVSKEENMVLAEGSFSIIGMALATPVIRITPTPFNNHEPR